MPTRYCMFTLRNYLNSPFWELSRRLLDLVVHASIDTNSSAGCLGMQPFLFDAQ